VGSLRLERLADELLVFDELIQEIAEDPSLSFGVGRAESGHER
jgi:hypothetical protein